jgi:hypothetical protein
MKWKVGEMARCQIGKLMKWRIGEMASWQNGNLMKWNLLKWQVDEMVSWQNGKLTKSQVDKVASCWFGNLVKMAVRLNCTLIKCSSAKKFYLAPTY